MTPWKGSGGDEVEGRNRRKPKLNHAEIGVARLFGWSVWVVQIWSGLNMLQI